MHKTSGAKAFANVHIFKTKLLSEMSNDLYHYQLNIELDFRLQFGHFVIGNYQCCTFTLILIIKCLHLTAK